MLIEPTSFGGVLPFCINVLQVRVLDEQKVVASFEFHQPPAISITDNHSRVAIVSLRVLEAIDLDKLARRHLHLQSTAAGGPELRR